MRRLIETELFFWTLNSTFSKAARARSVVTAPAQFRFFISVT